MKDQHQQPIEQFINAVGGVQVGYAGGNVTVVHVHLPFQLALPTGRAFTEKRRATPEQSEVLALMRDLPERPQILQFMEREFGTTLVLDLEGHDLYRLRRYVETIREHDLAR